MWTPSLALPYVRRERERANVKRKLAIRKIRRRIGYHERRRKNGAVVNEIIFASLQRKLARLESGAPSAEDQARHFAKRTVGQLCVAALLALSIAHFEGYFDRLSGPRYVLFTGPGFQIVGCKERERVSCEKNPQDREGKMLNVKALVAFEAQMQGVPIDFALAVAEQESGFTCNVISTADAMGVLQVLYPTAVEMGYRGKPEELLRCHMSAKFGVKYLKRALDDASGDLCLAANKYFAGTNAGFIDSGREYCRGVLAKMQRYKNVNMASF